MIYNVIKIGFGVINMKLKKLGICALILATSISLGACGSENDSSSTTSVSAKKEKNETAESLKDYLPKITDNKLELSDESYAFITKHPKWFPATSEKSIAAMKKAEDSSITIQHLNKKTSPYYKKVLAFSGTVLEIEESESGDLTIVHVVTNAGDSFQYILFGSSGDILEDDNVRIWGIPLGKSSFNNVSGGTTNVQVIFGTMIEKI